MELLRADAAAETAPTRGRRGEVRGRPHGTAAQAGGAVATDGIRQEKASEKSGVGDPQDWSVRRPSGAHVLAESMAVGAVLARKGDAGRGGARRSGVGTAGEGTGGLGEGKGAGIVREPRDGATATGPQEHLGGEGNGTSGARAPCRGSYAGEGGSAVAAGLESARIGGREGRA